MAHEPDDVTEIDTHDFVLMVFVRQSGEVMVHSRLQREEFVQVLRDIVRDFETGTPINLSEFLREAEAHLAAETPEVTE